LSTVQGSGRDGRILKEDIIAHQQLAKQPQPPRKLTPSSIPTTEPSGTTPSAGKKPREQKQTMSGIKRVMARTMTAAAQVPHFGYCDEYAMDGLQLLRAQLKPVAESKGIKLTYMPLFIKAASLALLRYPTLNSTINSDLTELTIKNYHNIGVAMDTPQGLLVPNIKDVQDKSVFEIAQELTRLHTAAINNQLSPADMSGGTFTLSNIGTIGGTYASPVLVIPEVVIGAIGKIQKVPRYDAKGNIIPVHLLQVSWSADHRVVDGATMANFSNLMKLFVEKPESMLAELR
jgi:2-oxoisovalerate dehydrogenase E2 component (dihydrolipoyl transacylase)